MPTDFPAQSTIRKIFLALAIAALLFGLPYLLKPIAKVLLGVFAGILLAIFIDAIVKFIRKYVHIPHWAAWSLTLFLLIAAIAGFGYFAGNRVVDEMSQLVERLPQAIDDIQSRISGVEWLQRMIPEPEKGISMVSDLMGKVTSAFNAVLAVFAYTFLILFLGIYLAFNPGLYIRGLITLLPESKRERGGEVLEKVGTVMRWWLVGRLSSMAVVGVLTIIGLYVIGEPLAFILGFIAGLLSFIPFLGPIFSAVPAILIGLSRSPMMALWVVVVFAAVQVIESNLITPIIQRKAVMLPPAFLIAAQFLLGVLVGFFGILLATPITVMFTVLVQTLYVQDLLGDRVKVLGDHSS